MDDRAMATLVVAISSGALFDLRDAFKVYKEQGVDAYAAYQIEKENIPLPPGPAFHLVKKLLALNNKMDKLSEVILLSRNSADTGLRVFNSIEHYGLQITRAAFTNGNQPYKYVHALGAQLFLSAYEQDVRAAIAQGCAAATMIANSNDVDSSDDDSGLLRVAFDGDAVLFSDAVEQMHHIQGVSAVHAHEREKSDVPLERGPFYDFVNALGAVQQRCHSIECPVRTALVTARSAPAHERVIKTLRTWGVRVDEAFFLGGRDKGELLNAFEADIFFDDQSSNCDSASAYVATGHVPFGIGNYPESSESESPESS